MATAVESRKSALTPESRFVIYGLDWKGYDTLLGLLEYRGVRLTYDRGSVELMTVSQDHAQFGHLLGQVVVILTDELYLPNICVGQMTWRREILDRGLEADDCFYLANAPRVRGKKIDLGVDPPPDLAIEVEIGRSALDRMGIYAALRAPRSGGTMGRRCESSGCSRMEPMQRVTPAWLSLSCPWRRSSGSCSRVKRWITARGGGNSAPGSAPRWSPASPENDKTMRLKRSIHEP
jgi:hypothetical protein